MVDNVREEYIEELSELLDWLLDTVEIFDDWSKCKISSTNVVKQFLNQEDNEYL